MSVAYFQKFMKMHMTLYEANMRKKENYSGYWYNWHVIRQILTVLKKICGYKYWTKYILDNNYKTNFIVFSREWGF